VVARRGGRRRQEQVILRRATAAWSAKRQDGSLEIRVERADPALGSHLPACQQNAGSPRDLLAAALSMTAGSDVAVGLQALRRCFNLTGGVAFKKANSCGVARFAVVVSWDVCDSCEL
jgi:hypothetical protein